MAVEKSLWEEEKITIATTHQFASQINLNIGGTRYSTSLSTLTSYPNSMLGAIFSGGHKAAITGDGAHFINRDGTHFRHILNFLRDRIIGLIVLG